MHRYGSHTLLQSGAILLQSGSDITKWDNYYRVGQHSKCQADL